MAAWLMPTKPKPKVKKTTRPTDAGTIEAIESSDESDGGRNRQKTKPPARTKADSMLGNALWSDTYVPQLADELCVQKKKIQELQDWLQQSIPMPDSSPSVFRKRLLFLCGPPGAGKSTALRCLAQRMGVKIKEWSDNAAAGRLQFHRMLQDQFATTHTSAWDDFIDFINRSINYSALTVSTVPERRRSRKRKHPQAHVSNESSSVSAGAGQVILLETWPELHSSSSFDASAWEVKLKQAFQQIVNPAANIQFPVVCVFSDARESKVDMLKLKRLFSDQVVLSPLTSVIQFNAVTAVQLKKTLVRILDQEDATVSTPELQQVIENSDGDIRHAINMLQLTRNRRKMKRERGPASIKKPSKSSPTSIGTDEDEEATRDPFLSDFHIIGKLLHGKSQASMSSNGGTKHGLVDFDRILDTSAMPLDRVLSLMYTNCAPYFTDIADLDQAISLMSLSETWMSSAYKATTTSETFQRSQDLSRSLLVRSIALTNAHPAPSAFRPIAGPRTFETRKRIAEKRQEASQFHAAEAHGRSESSLSYACRSDVFSSEIEPFLGWLHPSARRITTQAIPNGEDSKVDDEIESSDGDAW
ncbi:hypothetical protein Poli38472_006050 [Pythium oligandrum]|uniref:AAA+ ATPase domain-containing protein n=1 Tax=Pythium oligandrum TaxID=41045 RepID=A0A8K1FR37_PYTOL|nr:hypothetical protein Poli38472_006050 [Pythium oligandrum]|eukprot:TMW68582.1 hypothetical protein Poli38472_006050 [Pythium oligandrum]